MPKLTGLDVLRIVKANAATRSIPGVGSDELLARQDLEEIRALGAEGYQIKANLSSEALGNQVKKLLKD